MNILSIPALDNFPFTALQNYSYDLQEVRLDYSSEPLGFLDRLEYFFPIDPITIITIRDISEGGIHPFPSEKKYSLYSKLTAKYNCLVDCEMENYFRHKPVLPNSNLILSLHINRETSELIKSVESAIESANRLSLRYLKIVVPIESYYDLECLRELSRRSRNPLLLCGTGYLGKLSRIFWKLLGSKGTFTGLPGFETSPEQLHPEEYELFGSRQLDENTLIGGIIGGEQVYDSLGLKYYNQRLRHLDDKIVYLPLPVRNSQDFLQWLQKMNKMIRFYGFSVTMPCKTDLPKLFNVPDKPINLISVKTDRKEQLPLNSPELFQNTDREAFQKALSSLEIDKHSSILVWGSGASAQCFIEEFSYLKRIQISGRNVGALKIIAEKYRVEFLTLSDIKGKFFDLIINCTPLGMKNEDLFKVTGLSLPGKLIDLPYCEGSTKAIEKCAAQGIPFIDGKSFWHFQSKKQEEMFQANISKLL
jgi:shikimate dehydrogenase